MKIEELIELVEIQLGRKKVKASDHFTNDLQAESLDRVHLAAAIKDRFGIVVPEETLAQMQTVQDLYDSIKSQPTE